VIRNNTALDDRLAPLSAINDENFLIAKIPDSESATTRLSARARLTKTSRTLRMHHVRIKETAAAQVFPANLTNADAGGVGVFRNPISIDRVVVEKSTARFHALVRQHFLKRDAVFFDVLVYSE